VRYYEFGPFRLDRKEKLLYRQGSAVHVTPKVVEILLVLIDARGQLVEKDQLMSSVWPDRFVEEGNLTQSMSVLRKKLGENPEGGGYVETIPTRGYRFAATVREVEEKPAAIATRRRTGIAILCLSVAVAAGGIWIWREQHRSGPTSLAVLPFLNLSASEGSVYISDGLTEELIDRLVKVEGLQVVARTSVFQFKNRPLDIRRIGAQLNVQLILEGSVRRENNRLRVTAQLNNVADGYHLWSETYDGEVKDVFSIQEEIAQKIVQSLRQNKRLPGPGLRPGRPPRSVEAYDLYLQGQYQRAKAKAASVKKAIGLLEEAIRKDPEYEEAYSALGYSYTVLGYSYQMLPAEAFPKARAALQKALSLNPALGSAHAVQGIIHLTFDWDWRQADREFRQAINLDPGSGLAHHWYSHYLVTTGKFEQSLAESRRALEVEPLDLPISAHLGWNYFFTRQFDPAIRALEKSIDAEPNQYWAWTFLPGAYEQVGEFQKAIDVLEKSGASAQSIGALREALRSSGARGYWETRLANALKQSSEGLVRPCLVAQLYVRLDEKDRAFEWLERGLKARDGWMIYLKQDPTLDGLRPDRRFAELVKKVGIP
jgi:TolB-like protein/DNA-binding winged helix-turn-helix (wHTH) protein/Tfp pilus assembly protein PilF